jgi:prepilin-type N-terminal cleavage/methylation domain-containing protein
MRRGAVTKRIGVSIRRGGGFSLVEIIIALAIFGVGAAMIMAVFPVAIQTNMESAADVVGTIICDNALAILKAEANRADISSTTFGTNPVPVGGADCRYPLGDANASRGFLALGRRISNNPSLNDCQFVIISYRKKNPTNDKVQVRDLGLVTYDPNSTEINIPPGKINDVTLNSPVIDASTGAYAKVVSMDRNAKTATLDHPIDRAWPGPGNPTSNLLVVVETDGGGNLASDVSPATRVVVARTALKP